ncbi:MAG: aspartate carbamoyltransferase, partial [Bdellovibrionota bacterium]
MFSRGLISAADLNQKTILSLLSATHKNLKISTRKQGVLAFFEPSSRTKSSFELAGMDLGI